MIFFWLGPKTFGIKCHWAPCFLEALIETRTYHSEIYNLCCIPLSSHLFGLGVVAQSSHKKLLELRLLLCVFSGCMILFCCLFFDFWFSRQV